MVGRARDGAGRRSRHPGSPPRALLALLALAALLSLTGCEAVRGLAGGAEGSGSVAREVPPVDPAAGDVDEDDIDTDDRVDTAEAADEPDEPEEASGQTTPDPDTLAASFANLSAELGGQYAVAAVPVGGAEPVVAAGAVGEPYTAWSTSKVPVALAVLADGYSPGPDVRASMTASDNEAARRLWALLGEPSSAAAASTAQVRAHGDGATTIESRTLRAEFTAFGQTGWSVGQQARFAAQLPCSERGGVIVGLLEQVVPGQRWGMAAAVPGSAVKGGWGPGHLPGSGGGYLVRQLAIVTVDGRRYGVALAAVPANGSFDTGVAELNRLAQWVTDALGQDRTVVGC